MTVELDVSLILSLLAIITGIIAIATFAVARKKAAIEEGQHLEAVKQLRRDLDAIEIRTKALETSFQNQDRSIVQIATDIKYIREAIGKIEAKLDRQEAPA